MKLVKIHTIKPENNQQNAFKICTAKFDAPTIIDDPLQTENYNIIWIQHGFGKYIIDFNSYEASEQMIFFLTPGQMYKVVSEGIVKGVRISFNQDFYCVDTFASQASCNGVLFKNPFERPYIKIDDEQSQEFSRIVDRMNSEFTEPDIAHEELIHSYLQLFLIHATRIKKNQEKKINGPGSESDDSEFLNRFKNLLEDHFKTKHSVSDYAELLHVTPKTLHKKIKKFTGQPVSQLIHERIVLEAKRMLYHTDQTVKEIAYSLGFEDPSYFSRFFTKQVEEAPTEFQQRIRQ